MTNLRDQPRVKPKIFKTGIFLRTAICLAVALYSVIFQAIPVAALSFEDYFTYSYSVDYSETEITGTDVFYAEVEGEANCINDLPFPVSEARLTSRIVAEHRLSGTRAILNPSYSITTSPFPNQAGESTQASLVIPLQFPAGSQSGDYQIFAELIEAKIKAIVWLDVTVLLPASESVGLLTYSDSVNRISDRVVGPRASLSDYLDENGFFLYDVTVEAADGRCRIIIKEGTQGLTAAGKPLTEITVREMTTPPLPPDGSSMIGPVYDFGPDEATFNPPITLSLDYDSRHIPKGITEEKLFLTGWNDETGEWRELDTRVAASSNTVTANISHFSAFTVLAHTRPSSISVSNLAINPEEVFIGEAVTVSLILSNNGDLTGDYQLELMIDDEVSESRTVTLAGGSEQSVDFNITAAAAGSHTARIDGMSGTFVVKSPAAFTLGELSVTPAVVDIGEKVTISILLTNSGDVVASHEIKLKINGAEVDSRKVILDGSASQRVSFTTVPDEVGLYNVEVNRLGGSFEVRKEQAQAASWSLEPKWWLVAGVAAAVLLLSGAIWLVIKRHIS